MYLNIRNGGDFVKIHKIIIIGLILSVFLLTGCSNDLKSENERLINENEQLEQQLTKANQQINEQASLIEQYKDKYKNELIEAVPTESIDTKSMTKLDEFSYDVDADGSEEMIQLYIAAERDEKGELMLDDGQNWLLTVLDGGNAYPLLSEYVQLGSVYFSVSNNGEGEGSHINVIIQTGASFSLRSYSFDNDKGGFVGGTVYRSEDNNFIYTSTLGN